MRLFLGLHVCEPCPPSRPALSLPLAAHLRRVFSQDQTAHSSTVIRPTDHWHVIGPQWEYRIEYFSQI